MVSFNEGENYQILRQISAHEVHFVERPDILESYTYEDVKLKKQFIALSGLRHDPLSVKDPIA